MRSLIVRLPALAWLTVFLLTTMCPIVAGMRVTDSGYVDQKGRDGAALMERTLAIDTGRAVFAFMTNGEAIGMTRPSEVNWYGAEFFTVRVNGEVFFSFSGPAKKEGFVEKTKFTAVASDGEGSIEATQAGKQAKVSVVLLAADGEESLRMAVKVEPLRPLQTAEVSFQCFPNTMSPREKLSRALVTSQRKVVTKPGESPATVVLKKEENWFFCCDENFDLGAPTYGDNKATGGCGLFYVPQQAATAEVHVGDYHIDPVFTFAPNRREMHFVLLDFGNRKNNADALAQIKTMRTDWLAKKATERSVVPPTQPESVAVQNLVPPAISTMDSEEALQHLLYMRPSKETEERPRDFYRVVTANPYRGTGCLAVNTYGPNQSGIYVKTPAGPFKAGETLTASAYLRANETINIAIFLWTTDGDVAPKDQVREMYTLGPQWQQCKITGQLSKDAKCAWVVFRILHDDTMMRTFYVDEVKVERGSQASASEPNPESRETEARNLQEFKVPRTAQKPSIDGKLDDACWQDAAVLDTFYINDGKTTPAPQKNEVRVSFDDANLYFAVRCEEADLSRLAHLSEGRDKPDWNDDRIEFFVDALGTGTSPTYYLSVNSAGVTADQYLGIGQWNPKLHLATGLEERAWTLEAAIPIGEFGRGSIAGEQWRINVGRHHRGSVKVSSTLVPLEGGFTQPGRFALLTFAPRPGDTVKVISTSRGEMSRFGFRTGANRIGYSVDNAGEAGDLTFTIENRSGGRVLDRVSEKKKVGKGLSSVEQFYKVLGDKNELLVFEVKDLKGRVLFRSENQVPSIRPFFRVYDVKNPVYESLIRQGKPKAPRLNGDMVWGMPLEGYLHALQGGHEYSYAQTRHTLSDSGMHLLMGYSPKLPCIDGDSVVLRGYIREGFTNHVEENRKNTWAGPALYAPYYIIGVDEKGTRGANYAGSGILADPINRHAFIESVKGTLDEYGKDLWAVHAGDEQIARQQSTLDGFFNSVYDPAKPEHARFKLLEEEIKRDYGFGRFGLPHRLKSGDPDLPYCRRAYMTWLNDKLRIANREMTKAVKAKFPDMPVIAEDSHGGAVIDVEYWSEYAEMGPFQAQYTPDTGSMPYMFVTKLAKDLSGLEYIMVCPHDLVAGFPTGAMEADELRELYSQIFRGGGTGFDFWPASMGERQPTPPSAASLQSGYPLAWDYMVEVAKLTRNMPLLPFPKTETAIYIASESEKFGVHTGGRAYSLFTHLGPVARGWFRFLSDGLLDLKRERLDNYKVLYVPGAQYLKREIADEMVKFCENGGTLVCMDPLAFSNDVAANSLTSIREKLFGVQVMGERKQTARIVLSKLAADVVSELPVCVDREKAFDVKVTDSAARALATFEDGQPAIVEKSVGKGKTLYFAWSPLTLETASDANWRKFLTRLYVDLGGKTGHEIWNFQIPQLAKEKVSDPQGVCLTNNYAIWDRYEFVEGFRYNKDTGGEYTIESAGNTTRHSFAEGPLTNRLALRKKHVPGSAGPLVWNRDFNRVDWVDEIFGNDPVTVTFDFRKPFPLSNFKLFYAGEFPGATLETSADGKQWTKMSASLKPHETGEKEVASQDVAVATIPARYLRLTIPPRKSDARELLLAEVEVWGK
ncbi:MAG: hypothetical protein COS85_11995 [Armatimonadetes bacterium CG07_land_8_20_14_0_80_59_28]|nr:MAG: hypothetical protein COS85_11995 [Armatimonadetes bacterium CG07_land_8_20_14_0_80_59_28]PIY38884.1 MAG: hypothetical protein COZ05_20030 [Armatimonadetes bacterium CG_4_10_14_3_um_filter_59_10]